MPCQRGLRRRRRKPFAPGSRRSRASGARALCSLRPLPPRRSSVPVPLSRLCRPRCCPISRPPRRRSAHDDDMRRAGFEKAGRVTSGLEAGRAEGYPRVITGRGRGAAGCLPTAWTRPPASSTARSRAADGAGDDGGGWSSHARCKHPEDRGTMQRVAVLLPGHAHPAPSGRHGPGARAPWRTVRPRRLPPAGGRPNAASAASTARARRWMRRWRRAGGGCSN